MFEGVNCTTWLMSPSLVSPFHERGGVVRSPCVNENLHHAATHHALFARRFRRQTELVQTRFAGAQRLARLRPDFRFDTAAADRACRRAALEKEHLRSAPLRS